MTDQSKSSRGFAALDEKQTQMNKGQSSGQNPQRGTQQGSTQQSGGQQSATGSEESDDTAMERK